MNAPAAPRASMRSRDDERAEPARSTGHPRNRRAARRDPISPSGTTTDSSNHCYVPAMSRPFRLARVVLAGAALLWAAACVDPEPAPRPGAYEDVRRVVAVLDDVVGEYPLAVKDGAVIDATRLRVLDALLHEASVYGHRFPADEVASLHELERLVASRAPPARVVPDATALRRRLLVDHQIVIAPAAPPDRARAVQQWGMLCAGCHGVTGFGDGPQGLQFDPEPKDFHSWDLMSTLAPTRAFSWISDGVPGTAMPKWGLFSNSERWGLAFLTFGFRHDKAAIARGREIVKTLAMPHSLTALADLTDGDLLRELERRGLDQARAADALAFLRTDSVFTPPTGRMAAVRTALATVIERFRTRHYADARAALGAARDALAPALTAIRAQAPVVAARLEAHLARLDGQLVATTLDEVVDREVVRLGVFLDQAEQALMTPRTTGPLRLALEWALAPALALGLLLARRRARGAAASLAAVVALAALGAALPPGLPALGAAAAALLLLVAVATPTLRTRVVPCTLAAMLVGLALGALGRALGSELGTIAALPGLLGIAALALATAGTVVLAPRLPPRAERVVFAIVLAAAIAGCLGRAAWVLAPTVASPILALWTIEALGVFPTVPALVAAGAGMLVAVAIVAWTRHDAVA